LSSIRGGIPGLKYGLRNHPLLTEEIQELDHFAYYNFCRTHKTIRVTPAMEAGITDHVCTIGELIA